jgi:hypothetical protein
VAFEQNPDCLPTHTRNQFALDGLLGHEAYRPPRPACRRITAHHSDDALLLGSVENLLGPRPLLLVQRHIQATFDVAMGDLADGLGSQRDGLRNLRCGNPLASKRRASARRTTRTC